VRDLTAAAAGHSLQLTPLELDLSNVKSIQSFAQAFRRLGVKLHILVCNAAVIASTEKTTAEGIEVCAPINAVMTWLASL
jgi:WW domain-containing oxidoreductase